MRLVKSLRFAAVSPKHRHNRLFWKQIYSNNNTSHVLLEGIASTNTYKLFFFPLAFFKFSSKHVIGYSALKAECLPTLKIIC